MAEANVTAVPPGDVGRVLWQVSNAGIDYTQGYIHFNCGAQTFRSYMSGPDKWCENEDPHIEIHLYHDRVSRATRQAIKKLAGPMVAEDCSQPDLVNEIKLDGIRVQFRLKGTYECKTTCVAKDDFRKIRAEMAEPTHADSEPDFDAEKDSVEHIR